MLIFSWSTLASLSAMLMTKCYLLARKLLSLKEMSHSAYFRKNVAERIGVKWTNNQYLPSNAEISQAKILGRIDKMIKDFILRKNKCLI